MAKSRIADNTVGKDVGKLELLHIYGGNVKWCCHLESILTAPQK